MKSKRSLPFARFIAWLRFKTLFLAALTGPLILFSSCAAFQKKEFIKPAVHYEGYRLDYIDFSGVQVTLYLTVDNPNSSNIRIEKMEHQIYLNEKFIVTSSQQGKYNIKKNGRTTLEYPLKVPFASVPKGWKALFSRPSLEMKVDSFITVNNGLGETEHKTSWKQTLDLPPIPEVKIERVQIVKFDLNEATLVFHGRVAGPAGQSIRKIRWSARLEGNSVIEGETSALVNPDAGAPYTAFEMEVNLSLDQLFAVNRAGIAKGAVTYELELLIDMETPFGPVTLPLTSDGEFRWKVEL